VPNSGLKTAPVSLCKAVIPITKSSSAGEQLRNRNRNAQHPRAKRLLRKDITLLQICAGGNYQENDALPNNFATQLVFAFIYTAYFMLAF
jgi:hypothetical protein